MNLGIFEYADGWHKRFSPPYPQTEGKRWAYLAEHNGQVAFAITAMPNWLERISGNSGADNSLDFQLKGLKAVSLEDAE
jgi:hypothetical protein